MEKKLTTPKIVSWTLKKIREHDMAMYVCHLLVISDDFTGRPLLERKERRLAKMIAKCYQCA
jgi:hypothetical protein